MTAQGDSPPTASEPLSEIAAEIARHVYLSPEGIDAVTLWAGIAHLHDELEISPFLSLSSSQKRCGKSLLLDVIRELVPNPYAIGGRTGMRVIAEIISRHQPTLLIDECDTFLGGDAEIRGGLNASQRRGGAQITRLAGAETKNISTWCPKVLAGIGSLPETLADRSVRVVLVRRPADADIMTWRQRRSETWDAARARFGEWAASVREHFRSRMTHGETALPAILDDRAADTWEPLIVLGDLAGVAWGRRARAAAIALSCPTLDPAIRLAMRISDAIALSGEQHIHTSTLLAALSPSDGHIGARTVGQMMRGIGVLARNVTIQGRQAKGYRLSDVSAALRRASSQ